MKSWKKLVVRELSIVELVMLSVISLVHLKPKKRIFFKYYVRQMDYKVLSVKKNFQSKLFIRQEILDK